MSGTPEITATASRPGEREDFIGDYEVGRDRIGLGEIDADAAAAGNQRFVFLGAAAFGGEAGELSASIYRV